MSARSISRVTTVSLLSLTLLMLASCGGAGGGGSSIADGGIRGTGSSVGPVSGFGSVIVNGIRFVTENLGMDDFLGEAGIPAEDDLEKGMILQIRGEWLDDGEGEAEFVRYDDTLRGPVTAIPQAWDAVTKQGRMEVMGFAVTLDRLTQTTLADLATISVGQTLRISGWLRADGSFRASYVGSVTSADVGEEIEGYLSVTGDGANQRYFVGDLEIDVVEGAVCEDLELIDGTAVDIEGTYDSDLVRFVADTENGFCTGPADFLAASVGEDVQIAGVVTSAFAGDRDNGRFAVNGVPVMTYTETEFDDLVPSDITQGVLLQVEGQYLNDNGALTLRADEIEYRDADAEVSGAPQVDGNGLLSVGGVEIRLTPFTFRGDNDDDDLCPANLGDAAELEVEGIQRSSDGGYLEALQVECDDEGDDAGFELEGRVTALNLQPSARSLTVLGVTILVDESTGFDDFDIDSMSVGDRVEVAYTGLANGDFLAEEVEAGDD